MRSPLTASEWNRASLLGRRRVTAGPDPIRETARRPLVRTVDAALFLGINKHTLETWRARGTGPPFIRLPGTRTIVYDLDDLAEWALQGRIA